MLYQDQSQRDNMSLITVQREGQYQISDDFEAKNVYIYKGQENTLKINRVYSTEWLCEYEMTNYPFDTQVYNYQQYSNILLTTIL